MAFDSFRDWVNHLEKAGELIRLQQPVATELEITELADRQMKAPSGGKALLIEKPTVNGVASPFPLAINTLGSWKRMALSLGASSVDDVAAELGSLMKAKPPMSGYPSLPAYAGLLEELDQSVGRIVAAVDAAGLAKDTLILFLSDNGGLEHEQSGRRGGRTSPSSALSCCSARRWLPA